MNARQWIEHLGLTRHPEGGYYREVYRSQEIIKRAYLPERFSGDRCFATAIYFLLEGDDFSAFHRIRQDEIWHFYDGSPLTIHVISQDGGYSTLALGRDADAAQRPMAVVGAGDLFAAQVDEVSSFSLLGCTVAPGFDFADFDMPGRDQLLREHTQHRDIIETLSRS